MTINVFIICTVLYCFIGTVEITTVLSALFGVIALMLLFFLYVNRKWCFHARRGIHCCDEKHLASKCVQKLCKSLKVKTIFENHLLMHTTITFIFK